MGEWVWTKRAREKISYEHCRSWVGKTSSLSKGEPKRKPSPAHLLSGGFSRLANNFKVRLHLLLSFQYRESFLLLSHFDHREKDDQKASWKISMALLSIANPFNLLTVGTPF
jgi:hypothetical protein